jgi:hypothetical protein
MEFVSAIEALSIEGCLEPVGVIKEIAYPTPVIRQADYTTLHVQT